MNSVVLSSLLIRTLTDPSIRSRDPSADVGLFVSSFKLFTDRPSFGRISGWNAVMLAPVSGSAAIFSFLPSMFSTVTSTSSSFSGLWADAIFKDVRETADVLAVDGWPLQARA